MPQLDISTYSSQIFWFFLCFGFLILFIKNKLIPKIDLIIEINADREIKIQRLNLETQAHLTEFQHQLKWQMQEAKHRYEDDLKSYLKEIQSKIVPLTS